MAMQFDDREKAVLQTFYNLDVQDSEGAWASYYTDVIAAVGDHHTAHSVCMRLRQRKLLAGQGRGVHASYYITDKGRAEHERLTS